LHPADKRRVMMVKKVVVLSILLVGFCAVQSASGVPHYSGNTDYYFEDSGKILSGTIEFAVFDTEVDSLPVTSPGEGRYLYAYQIWNDEGDAQEAVGYFSVLLGGATVDGIGSEALTNDTEGMEPSESRFADHDGDAEFWFRLFVPQQGLSGEDLLEPGRHSYILMFTSDNDWVAGEYEIEGGDLGNHETDFPSPPGSGSESESTTPEPATILILGMGASIALMKRKHFLG
jgi:hypothetical protein